MSTASMIDVGQLIDDSKLNRVSIRIILLCGFIMIMDGFDYQLMAVTTPTIMKEWNVSSAWFGFVLAAAPFGYLFGALICGVLSDRIGRKKTLLIGACCFSVGTLLVYFSHSIVSLIPIRIFAGMGIGGAVPCAITLTSEYSPAKGRGKYVSVMYSGFLVGIVLAGYIAGFLLNSVGWRPLFLIGFVAPIVMVGVLAFVLPESARWLSARYKTEKQRQALVQIIRGIQPDIAIEAKTRFTAAAPAKEEFAFSNLFVGRLRTVTPLIWAYYLISSIPVFFIGNWATQLLVEKGFTNAEAALISGNVGIPVAVACFLSGFYFDKFGFRRGWILHVIAGVLLILMGGVGTAGFVILLFASAFFVNAGHMDVTILAPIVYPSNCRNKGAGTAIGIARIGAIAGPSLGGLLLSTALPRGRLMALVSIPLMIVAVLCYIAGRQYDFYLAGGKR